MENTILLYLIEHEGKKIAVESANAAYFRSAIRFVRNIRIDRETYYARCKRREDRKIADAARRGIPKFVYYPKTLAKIRKFGR